MKTIKEVRRMVADWESAQAKLVLWELDCDCETDVIIEEIEMTDVSPYGHTC